MLKRFFLALSIVAGLLSPAYSAGTIGLSLTQRFDAVTAKPLNAGKLYFIQAGTTATPQNAFQDSALTIPWPNPMTLDAGGNVPQLFFADGLIKIRLTNSAGVNQIVADNILVVGASSGGGGGGTVDPTTILSPCDMKVVYGTGALSGFVRMNGRTIGNAVSGATERGNADTLATFTCLYNNDTNLVVSGGRGANAAADYAAGKTITTPDFRGRALAGLGDMGNSDAGRLTSTYFGATPTVLGAASTFTDSRTILTSWLPPYTPAGANSISNITSGGVSALGWLGSGSITPPPTGGSNGVPLSTGFNFLNGGSITFTGTPQGGTSTPFSAIQPTMLVTVYLKL